MPPVSLKNIKYKDIIYMLLICIICAFSIKNKRMDHACSILICIKQSFIITRILLILHLIYAFARIRSGGGGGGA